jgi:predicted membrane channel-forming protein YqfA (hemolysin III family)
MNGTTETFTPTNRTKSFDYAQEVTKQVLTLATGVVTITLTFLKDIAVEAPLDARTLLYIGWALFAISILAGIATLLNLTGNVENAEDEARSVYAKGIVIFSIAQLFFFFAGVCCIVYFGARAFS